MQTMPRFTTGKAEVAIDGHRYGQRCGTLLTVLFLDLDLKHMRAIEMHTMSRAFSNVKKEKASLKLRKV